MYSERDLTEVRGFPIRKSPDQSLLSSSPKHIAACHVLHRLLVPRHPPNALSSLLFFRLRPYLRASEMISSIELHGENLATEIAVPMIFIIGITLRLQFCLLNANLSIFTYSVVKDLGEY